MDNDNNEANRSVSDELAGTPEAGVAAAALPDTHVAVPIEPPPGVLISMATCLDHGFGLQSSQRQEARLYDMRKLYDEIVGQGYYRPEQEGYYRGFLNGDADRGPLSPVRADAN